MFGSVLESELGPLSVQAIKAFQRTWELPIVGTAGPNTQRLLAFVSCQREIVTLPAPAALVA